MPHHTTIAQQAAALALNGKINDAMILCGDSPALLVNLGVLLTEHLHFEDAVTVLMKARHIAPHLSEAIASLSAALNELGRYQDAADLCFDAVQNEAVPPQIHNNLSLALNGLGRQNEAIIHLRLTAEAMPDNSKVWMNLGNTALEIGNTDEAARAYARAIDLCPDDGSYHRSLSVVHRYTSDDPHLIMMEELLPQAETWEPLNRMQLDFALGKAYDELGRFDDAMTHFLRGNAIKRSTTPYNEATTLGVLDAMEQTITPDFLREHGGNGDFSDRPIFIVGMPRSGTTLVEQIISSLPGVMGMGELMDFQNCVSGAGQFPASGPTKTWFDGLGRAYIRGFGKVSPQFIRIIDKMPSNFIYAGLIHLSLPNARIIHLHRDPIDTCLSCFSRLFSGDQPFSYDLAELGRYYRRYERLMVHWRTILPDDAFLDVSYENLVSDFEPEARRLVAFCGLDWNDTCLDFHKTNRSVKTASAAQVRQPLYTSSVGRHQHYAPYLGPLLSALQGH